MIRSFSDWQKIDEVLELTDETLTGKYFQNVVAVYEKYPNVKPSRDINSYQNAKKSPQLSKFVISKAGGTSAEIVKAVINDWYKWPDKSSSKSILLKYIDNQDDLANLTIGTVGGAFIGDILTLTGGMKPLVKSFAKGSTRGIGKEAAKSAGRAAESFNLRYKNSERIDEGVLAAIAIELGLWALGTAINYTLYGSEEVYDDPLFFWTAPYLPSFKGFVGDNPLKATYVGAFNFAMALVYDAWSLSMGQEKYGNVSNPILSWQNEKNYITDFFNEYYDNSMKPGFTSFMNSLKTACLNDSKTPQIFSSAPFYYTAEKMRIFFEDETIQNIPISDWQKWVRSNYQNYYITPRGSTEFNAKKRQGGFKALERLGLNDQIPGDPFREITIKWNDGTVTKSSLLQFEIWLLTSGKADKYSIGSQDISKGGSSIELLWKQSPEKTDQEIPKEDKPMATQTSTPSLKSGSSFDDIAINIQAETLDSFTGLGDI